MPQPTLTPETRFHSQLLGVLYAEQKALDKFYARLITRVSNYLAKYENTTGKSAMELVKKKGLKAIPEMRGILGNAEKDFEKYLESSINRGVTLSREHSADLAKRYVEGMGDKANKVIADSYRRDKLIGAWQRARVSGLGNSVRVWRIGTEKLIGSYVQEGLATGRSAAGMARDLKQFLREPDKRFRRVRDPETGKLKLSNPAKDYHPGRGVYRSSYKNALRLARNEINIAYRHSQYERIQGMKFVLGIKVNLSPSHPRYDICDELQGVYPKEFRFVGWHPNCLCYVTTELLPREQFKKHLNGEEIHPKKYRNRIPKRAERFIEKNRMKLARAKSAPYWLEDNFKMKSDKSFKPVFELKVGPVIAPDSKYFKRADWGESVLMTAPDKDAISDYTSNSYRSLHEIKTTSKEDYIKFFGERRYELWMKKLKEFETALDKLEASEKPFEGKVFRGQRFIPGSRKHHIPRVQKLLDSIQKNKPLVNDTYMSTSFDQKVVWDFLSSRTGRYEVNVVYHIETKKGINIMPYSEVKREKEVLIRAQQSLMPKEAFLSPDGETLGDRIGPDTTVEDLYGNFVILKLIHM